MAKLNQIIAIEKGIKSRVIAEIDALDKAAQKPALFNGFSKEYRKKDEDGEDLPADRQRVQFRATDVIEKIRRLTGELFEVTARKDWTNCLAVADIKIGEQMILADVPISHLLFLEKQLTDMRTLFGRLPTLDESESWAYDSATGVYRSETAQTHRTKKIARPIVLYPATPEHPAQTQLLQEDIIAGFWQQTKTSGALPKPARDAIVANIEKLLIAVKEAREAANGINETVSPNVGEQVFNYILAS